MTGTATPLVIRLAEVSRERDAICSLLAAGFEELSAPAAADKVSTQYIDNPAGIAECLVLAAHGNTELVGMQALVRRKFITEGGSVSSCSIADFVILPEHRILGPALRLLKTSLTHGSTAFDLIYGFPNEKAAMIFTRAGFAPTGQMFRYVKLARSKRLVESRAKLFPRQVITLLTAALDAWIWLRDAVRGGNRDLVWSSLDDFDSSFDKLWSTSERRGLVLGLRSQEQLAWRFGKTPGRRISLCRHRRNGNVMGYVIWVRGSRAVRILDVFASRPFEDLTALLNGFSKRIRSEGADSVSVELVGPLELREAFRRAGYSPREKVPFFASAGDNGLLSKNAIESLYLTAFDRDSI